MISYTPNAETQASDTEALTVIPEPEITDAEFEALDRNAGMGRFFKSKGDDAVSAIVDFVRPVTDKPKLSTVKTGEETGEGIRIQEQNDAINSEMEDIATAQRSQEAVDIPEPNDLIEHEFVSYDPKTNKPSYQPRMDSQATYKLENIEDDRGVDSAIQMMAETYKEQITEARRGVVGDEDAKALANNIGVSPERMNELLTRPNGTTASVEEVFAMRKLMDDSASRLHTIAKTLVDGQGSPEDKLKFERAFLFNKDLLAKFMGYRAEAGRSLRAYGVNLEGFGNANDQQNALDLAMSGIDTQRMANIIAMSGDVKSINDATKQLSNWRKAIETGASNFINSILSGVSTQVVNTASGVFNQTFNGVDRLIASGGTRMRSMFGFKTEAMVAPEEASMLAVGTFNSWRQAFKVGAQSFKTGDSYDGIGKFQSYKNPLTSEYWGVSPTSNMGYAIDAYGKGTGFMIRNVMGATDGFFKLMAEQGQYSSLAYRNAYHDVMALNLPNDEVQSELHRRTKDYLNNPTPAMISESKQYAKEITYMDESDTAVAITNLVKTQPWLKLFVPFVNTPTSIFKQNLVNRTPLGVFRPAVYKNSAEGQIARAQLLSGSLMMGGAWYLADQGFITGSKPLTLDGIKRWESEGRQEHSIAFPNKDGSVDYLSYARMENVSYMLSMVSDYQQMYNAKDLDWEIEDTDGVDRVVDTMSMIAVASMRAMEDKTFISGFDTLIDVIGGGRDFESSQDKLNTAITRLVVPSIVPLTGMQRDVNWLLDGKKRDARELGDKFQDNLLFLSKNAPNRLDYFGRPIENEQRINPFKYTNSESSVVFRELDRLYTSTYQEVLSAPPRRVEGIKLTSQEYHDMVVFVRRDEHEGKTFKQVMESIIKAPSYKNLNDRTKVNILKNTMATLDSSLIKVWVYSNPEVALKVLEHQELLRKQKGIE